MELLIGRQQRRNAQIEHLLHRIFAGDQRNRRIQPGNGIAQATEQQDLLEVFAPWIGRIGGNVVAANMPVAGFYEPRKSFLFELVFGHFAPGFVLKNEFLYVDSIQNV